MRSRGSGGGSPRRSTAFGSVGDVKERTSGRDRRSTSPSSPGGSRFSLKQFKARALRPAEDACTARKENAMPASEISAPDPDANARADDMPDDEPVPVIQQLLENPFLLLFIGVAMPTVLYIVWGVMEIVNIPVAK